MSRRAVLVGVQRCPAAQLRGPENDVAAMRSVLVESRFDYEVEVLRDPHKKRDDIMEALAKLVAGAGTGDSLLFYYSGHGTHVTVGVIWLITMLVLAIRGKVTPAKAINLEIAALYWHFVDVVWIVIFPVVYLMR